MVCEKTPALFLKKVSLDQDPQNERWCTRSTLSWICAVAMVALLVVVSIQFLYPCVEHKLKYQEDSFHMFEEQSAQVKVITAGNPNPSQSNKNPWDFEFLIDPPNLCITRNPPNSYEYQQDPEIKLLMLVPSAPDHFEQRRTIRNTWGSIAEKPLGQMRLGFVLGTSNNGTINDGVREENKEYRDIIQVDLDDSFYHQTTKSVLMLKWVAKRCPHAQYFLKADDDTFVNLVMIADILGTEPFVSERKFIGGYVRSGIQLVTEIPEEKSLDQDGKSRRRQFPPYTAGSAYVMTGPTAIDLFHASKEVQPFLPQEDAFLTGLCADSIDVPRIHDPRFIFDNPPNPPSWEAFSTLATAHSVTPDIMDLVWNDMSESVMSVLSHLVNQEFAMNATFHLRRKRHLGLTRG